MLLSKDDILKHTGDIPFEDVEVPEWGGVVRIRGLTGAQRDEMEAEVIVLDPHGREGRDLTNVRAKLVAKCAINEEGERLFTDPEAHQLGEVWASVLDRLFDTAQRLSGLTPADVEKMVEGFGGAPSGPSTSPLPSPGDAPSQTSSPAPPPTS